MPADRFTRWSQIHEGARVEISCGKDWCFGTVEWSAPDEREAHVKLDRNGCLLVAWRLADIRPLPEPRP